MTRGRTRSDQALTTPADISNAVLYLAAHESRHVTASAMAVDAGATRF